MEEWQGAECGNECEIDKMTSKSGRSHSCKVFFVILVHKDEAEGEDNGLGEGGNSGNGKKFSDSGDIYK